MAFISITDDIYFDDNDLKFKAVRSSGPGGQHVNKVSSRIILMLNFDLIKGIADADRLYIKERLQSYLVQDDIIQIGSQKYRSQHANRQDAFEKLIQILKLAVKKRKRRRKTGIPGHIKEKRLREKKARARIKGDRKYRDDDL